MSTKQACSRKDLLCCENILLYYKARMIFVFWEMRKKAWYFFVCSTIKLQELFILSFVWLSSAAFCVAVTDFFQKLWTMLVRFRQCFSFTGSKQAIPSEHYTVIITNCLYNFVPLHFACYGVRRWIVTSNQNISFSWTQFSWICCQKNMLICHWVGFFSANL